MIAYYSVNRAPVKQKSTYMIVKVRAKLTPKLDHPIHQHRPLPELILEFELLDPRPVHLGHLAPAQSTILLMHDRQIMSGLLGHLG
jgi:hypothetical protein